MKMTGRQLYPALLTLGFASISFALGAQTSAAPAHHSVTAAHHYEAGGCAKLPAFSPKIPALPAGAACAKALYTLTRIPDIKVDYVSPLVGPEVRAILNSSATTFSLDYVDTKIGAGELALPHKWYTVRYSGYLPDGTEFDSSTKHPEPLIFPYGTHHMIEGIDTGLEGMRIGGQRRLFIPYQLAYGENGRPPVIPARSELIFDVELVSQSDTEPKPAPRPQSGPGRPAPSPMTSRPTQPATPPASTPPASTPNTPINTTTPNATPPTPK